MQEDRTLVDHGAVSLQGVDKSYNATKAVSGVSLTVSQGEFFCLLGATSAGKTTTLRMIAGVTRPDAGTIHLNGRDVTFAPVAGRDLGMVFQGFALFPHMSVTENLTYPLIEARLSSAQIAQRLKDAADLLSIGHILEKKPAQLSGGERQRIAIGRAIIARPSLLLLDEPLTNLDAKLRNDMRVELKRIHRETGATIIYATPDQLEAMTMSQRIGVLKAGRLISVAAPMEHYLRPSSLDVAELVGSPGMNFINATAESGHLDTAIGSVAIRLPGSKGPKASVKMGFYPHAARIGGTISDEALSYAARVVVVEPIGDQAIISLRQQSVSTQVVVSARQLSEISVDAEVRVSVPLDRIVVFDSDSRQRLFP